MRSSVIKSVSLAATVVMASGVWAQSAGDVFNLLKGVVKQAEEQRQGQPAQPSRRIQPQATQPQVNQPRAQQRSGFGWPVAGVVSTDEYCARIQANPAIQKYVEYAAVASRENLLWTVDAGKNSVIGRWVADRNVEFDRALTLEARNQVGDDPYVRKVPIDYKAGTAQRDRAIVACLLEVENTNFIFAFAHNQASLVRVREIAQKLRANEAAGLITPEPKLDASGKFVQQPAYRSPEYYATRFKLTQELLSPTNEAEGPFGVFFPAIALAMYYSGGPNVMDSVLAPLVAKLDLEQLRRDNVVRLKELEDARKAREKADEEARVARLKYEEGAPKREEEARIARARNEEETRRREENARIEKARQEEEKAKAEAAQRAQKAQELASRAAADKKRIEDIRSGRVPPKNLLEAVEAFPGEDGNGLLQYPPLVADGKNYGFRAALERVEEASITKPRRLYFRGPTGGVAVVEVSASTGIADSLRMNMEYGVIGRFTSVGKMALTQETVPIFAGLFIGVK